MKNGWLTCKRWMLRKREFEYPYAALIATALPTSNTTFNDAELVSLDMETTSLDAGVADMLSVGWVLIRNGRVDLQTAESYIVRADAQVGSSAVIHGLTDSVVASGDDWTVVIDRIVEILTGRLLVVHHAGLDKTLLDRMCGRRYDAPLLVPVIDTLALEHRWQRSRHHIDAQQSLRLPDLRAVYHLPRYKAHDCLVDAVATAELLIAMVATRYGRGSAVLSDLF